MRNTRIAPAPWGQDQIFSGFTGASRQGLGQRGLGEIQVPLPPLPEQQRITGASRQGLSHSDLGLIRIPFPKIKVQREIVGRIEQHDLKHRNPCRCIESQIATLTGYRKSLIHECVTGQRRVTEADLNRAQNRSAGA